MIPTLFSSHYINIILCFPRIRTWLPRGHSINTAWQATWLLGSSVNSLGLLGVKASVFQQLWGMICVHQPHCDLISLRRGGFFHLKVPACPRSVRSRRGRMGWCPPSGSFPGDNQTEPTEICYLAVAKSNANSTYHAESLKFCPMFTRRTHRQLTSIREKKTRENWVWLHETFFVLFPSSVTTTIITTVAHWKVTDRQGWNWNTSNFDYSGEVSYWNPR